MSIVLVLTRHPPLVNEIRDILAKTSPSYIVMYTFVNVAEFFVHTIRFYIENYGTVYIVPILPVSVLSRLRDELEKHGLADKVIVLYPVFETLAKTLDEVIRQYPEELDRIIGKLGGKLGIDSYIICYRKSRICIIRRYTHLVEKSLVENFTRGVQEVAPLS